MRILILGLNFTPELIGIGKYTGEMAAWLAEKGNQVRTVTTPPYYPAWRISSGYAGWKYHREVVDSVEVWRCPLWVPTRVTGFKRLLHLASFGLSSFPAIFLSAKWRPEVILCVVPTLFVAPWALLLSRMLKVPAWLHIHDFEVEAAFELGMLSHGSVLQRLLTWFEERMLRGFHRVSTLSERMRDKLVAKGADENRTVLLPNWVNVEQVYPLQGNNPLRSRLQLPENQIVVLYSGNIGFKQDIDTLLDAAEVLLDKPDITIVLCGDGAARERIQREAEGLQNVIMIPLQPLAHLNELLNLADIHVLPQRADVADLVMPSKLGGMLASGRPIVATADPMTEVGEVVGEAGMLVPPGNSHKLAEAICQLAEDPDLRDRLGILGCQHAKGALNKGKILHTLDGELINL